MRGMTVAEYIEELRRIPQGYEVCIATSGGHEPFWGENMTVSSRDGRVMLTPTDERGEPAAQNSADCDDRCEHADDCMHFEKVRRFRNQDHVRRNRSLAEIHAANARN